MKLKDIESLRQIISSLFLVLRMQQEQMQKLSASGQALRDAIAARDPELFQKFQELYLASEQSYSEAHASLVRLIDEQLTALKKMDLSIN